MNEEVKKAIAVIIQAGFFVESLGGGYLYVFQDGIYRYQTFYSSTTDYTDINEAIEAFLFGESSK